MNILAIMPGSFPDNIRPEVKETHVNHLAKRGHKIKWVISSSDKLWHVEERMWNGIHVYISPSTGSTSIVGRAMNSILNLKKFFLIDKLARTTQVDIVHVRNTIFGGLLAIYLKKTRHIPFVYMLSTYFLESRLLKVKLGLARYQQSTHIMARLMQPLQRYIFREADTIIAQSKWMMEDLIKRGIPSNKIIFIPMGVKKILLNSNATGKEFRKKYNLEQSPTLLYLGSMDKLRKLDFLIETIAIVKNRIDNVRLLMVGYGNDRERLEEITKKLGLQDNIIFTGKIPDSEVPECIVAADIGVSIIPTFPIFMVSSPTKMVEYMIMSKPVVCNDIPDQKEIVQKSRGGICTSYDKEEIADALVELISNPRKIKEMGQQGHDYIIKNRLYDTLFEKLEKEYNRLYEKGVGTSD